MIVSCILRQIQYKIFVLTLIDNEVFVYAFIDKFFAQQHDFFFHSLIYSRRLREFDDQFALIDDITHVAKIIMTFENHIERFFLCHRIELILYCLESFLIASSYYRY